jgi:enoyl-CoA hydratase
MSDTDFRSLSLEVRAGIAHIRFIRPELANRFDELAHVEFAVALEKTSQLDAVRVLIISAEGTAFSAGGDFDEIIAAGANEAVRERMARDAKRMFDTLVKLRFPVIAAVQGAAIGLGATIMTLCDIVVAYEDAVISDPHVRVGIVAGDGGIIGWSQSIGLNCAKRHLLTGDHLTAREAHAMGLVTDLVNAPDEVMECAEEIAQRIVTLPRAGVEGTKRAFSRLTQQTALVAFDVGLAYELESLSRPEVAQTIARLQK